MKLIHPAILAMEQFIKAHHLDLLAHYPNDLLHDQLTISRFGLDDYDLAWCIGHRHSHLYPIGMHAELSSLIANTLDLSQSDLYCLLSQRRGLLKIIPLSRTDYAALAKRPIPFTQRGSALDGEILSHGQVLARYKVSLKSDAQNTIATMNFYLQRSISKWEQYACWYHAHRSICQHIHSLFYTCTEINWHTGLAVPLRA